MKFVFNTISAIFALWGTVDLLGGVLKQLKYRWACDVSCLLQAQEVELTMIRGLIMLILAKMLWVALSPSKEQEVDKAIEPTL